MATEKTGNFKFEIPVGNTAPWLEIWRRNWETVDATMAMLFTISNFTGAWDNSTAYEVDDVVVDTDTGVLFKAAVAHNSPGGGITFIEDRIAHDDRWIAYASTVGFRGIWASATQYEKGDAVVSGDILALAAVGHTSTTTFANDLAAGKWTVLIDFGGVQAASEAAQAAAEAAAATIPLPTAVGSMIRVKSDLSGYELRTPAEVRSDIGGGTPITTAGDVIVGDATGVAIRLAIGAADRVLASNSAGTAVQWRQLNGALMDVISAVRGTMIYRGAASTWDGLGIGAANTILKAGGAGTDPAWATVTAMLDAIFGTTRGTTLFRGAAAWSSLAPGTAGQYLQTAGSGADPVWATVSAGLTLQAPVNVTSTIAVTISSTIPSTANMVLIHFEAISSNSSSLLCLQIGDSGGIETTGYVGSANVDVNATSNSASGALTTAWRITMGHAAAHTLSGLAIMSRLEGNTWCIYGANGPAPGATDRAHYFSGVKTLSAVLTQIRIITEDGASVFDGAGRASISYI